MLCLEGDSILIIDQDIPHILLWLSDVLSNKFKVSRVPSIRPSAWGRSPSANGNKKLWKFINNKLFFILRKLIIFVITFVGASKKISGICRYMDGARKPPERGSKMKNSEKIVRNENEFQAWCWVVLYWFNLQIWSCAFSYHEIATLRRKFEVVHFHTMKLAHLWEWSWE